MKLLCLMGLVFFVTSFHQEDYLTISRQGEPLAVIERANFSVPVPGLQMVDHAPLDSLIEKLDKETYRPPQNAVMSDNGEIISEQAGYKLNRQVFIKKFYSYFYGKGSSSMEVPILSVYPKVDSELLSHINVQKIGEYTTYLNANNKTRTHNISLAVKGINNYVVLPGETFSFNKVVGKRTAAKGYLRAPIIVKGELAEGIGGGICQVSSTLFNAVDRAGLGIVQRYSHSKSVSYVPPGRDATVSWYGPDFSFVNKYNQPVLIRANSQGGRVIIKIYSSDTLEYKTRVIPGASHKLPHELKVIPRNQKVNQ
ncbi:hypothetical protein ELQ35_05735 [Peribacillus cavernae]|uniref:Peptidoglycan binding domain-containing protein n=1 Tax=Peribacillus cavernae TaxID=1674310 RepID=A0A3S0U4S6_9BACI|nr:VanW family protein [Peribacillus cavernae]MDQ0220615.1 vancomycin resistance protein YoaR [Peribacillus cavernae]RUQ31081.1 hypothetical protein ELQ35_05735 [Peribacillus cavernae]